MRTIIAGSRSITDISCVQLAMSQCSWTPSLVLSGTARGVDQLGEQWAKENNIKVARFPADWSSHGKGAGYIRNELMADNADALVALWDGESRGTKHMIKIARSKKLRYFCGLCLLHSGLLCTILLALLTAGLCLFYLERIRNEANHTY